MQEGLLQRMGVSVYHIDAFSIIPFAGNPAAVCLLHTPAPNDWMQQVASEMNLSETAFVSPSQEGFLLRWFTPTREVNLCGHATLASAHVLYETAIVSDGEEIIFHTNSGELQATRENQWIRMNFPSDPSSEISALPGLSEALNIQFRYVGRSSTFVIVEAYSPVDIMEMKPDIARLSEIPTEGVIVTAPSCTSEYDFISRVFAPRLGIEEDPVTGSAHCVLGPYWQARLGKDTFMAYQASKRGGMVRVQVAGSRTYLSGQAVTVYSGVIRDFQSVS